MQDATGMLAAVDMLRMQVIGLMVLNAALFGNIACFICVDWWKAAARLAMVAAFLESVMAVWLFFVYL